jgi:hypothetical protein
MWVDVRVDYEVIHIFGNKQREQYILGCLLSWFILEASLKSWCYSASKNTFIQVLFCDMVLDSFFCNFEFKFCVLSHLQRRGLTSVYTVILKNEKSIAYAMSRTMYKC